MREQGQDGGVRGVQHLGEVSRGKEQPEAALHGLGHSWAGVAPHRLNALGIKPWRCLHTYHSQHLQSPEASAMLPCAAKPHPSCTQLSLNCYITE